jgi:hypothetical protein
MTGLTLSKRQYPMLKMFATEGAGFHMSMKTAQSFDQRPFRSMLIRGYVAYRPGHGFHLTRTGRDAWIEFERTDIARKNPFLPLTAYFDPTAYGLSMPRTKKGARVVPISRRRNAA